MNMSLCQYMKSNWGDNTAVRASVLQNWISSNFILKCSRGTFSVWHYGDIIMGAIASQITSLTIVYSTVYSDAYQRKHQSSASLAFDRWIPRTKGSSAENISIWWRHHELVTFHANNICNEWISYKENITYPHPATTYTNCIPLFCYNKTVFPYLTSILLLTTF